MLGPLSAVLRVEDEPGLVGQVSVPGCGQVVRVWELAVKARPPGRACTAALIRHRLDGRLLCAELRQRLFPSLLCTAEELSCHKVAAAHAVPGLQAVDGVATATEVTSTRAGEEAWQVPGTGVAVEANGGEVLWCGGGRREWNIRQIKGLSKYSSSF